MIRMKAVTALAIISATAVALAGCTPGGSSPSSSGQVNLTYALWDTSQQPAYQACAVAFQKGTGITVKVRQTDYVNYWTGLSTDFAAGTAPDVFTDVTNRYPDYVRQSQIIDLTDLIHRDNVDMKAYQPLSVKNWVKDGKTYGLPKDIDTVGLAYNSAATGAAGVDPQTLNSLTWNPADGGSFGKLIKQLTVDANGKNGLDPAFDKSKVARYGISSPSITDISGHNDWGNLSLSTGQQLLSPNPFGTKWGFAQSGVVDTISWYQKMIRDGFMQTPSLNSSLSTSALFDAGKIALATDGSWNVGVYAKGKEPVKWAKLPAGPVGKRAYTNSLADSINANSKHPDEAWKWVKYLGTSACQDLVAGYGVVFPALTGSTAKAIAAYSKNGVDMQPFLDTIQAPGTTVPLPITTHYSEVEQAGDAAIQDILLNGKDPASTLKALTDQANALYK